MPAGESLTPSEQQRISKAADNAERISGLIFSVYLGVTEADTRAYAERLHGALADPARSVLVVCDPSFRAVEVVTGRLARRQLDEVACGLAIATMKSSFLGGDIIGGVAQGVQQLGEAAYQPETLHGH